MKNEKTSHERQLDELEAELAEDLLAPETSIEVVREQLRAAGGNPEEIRYEAAILVEAALKKLDTASPAAAPRPRRSGGLAFGRMNKEQLVRHVNALRTNPAAERALRSRLSTAQPEAISEDELRTLLEEFESLFDETDEDGTK